MVVAPIVVVVGGFVVVVEAEVVDVALTGRLLVVVELVVAVATAAVVVALVSLVVEVGACTGVSGPKGGFEYTLSAFGTEGCLCPTPPAPNASSTFVVIARVAGSGHSPTAGMHAGASVATQLAVPVANTPPPLGVL